ncbi:hypothetical protein [Burkholderia sp. Bp8998]|uniref:hypothetical protein n=1 Tax=Burkholderia sp. Bp8998 TaxID=2184557 RepID=UPI000F5A8553|nr:hypothetical protein [Burkholderia sp. Bp8998]RQS09154.1 hypothetical protein DIE06_32020 [Burkholderia sp. Bp8998]
MSSAALAASDPVPTPATGASAPDAASSGANATAPAPASSTAPEPKPIDFSKYLKDDKVGYAGLAVERATIQKSLADEHYLRDDRTHAEASYTATIATLDNEAPDEKLTDTQKSVKKLLHVDVEYRLLNLSLGNDFWSGYRTDRPSTPQQHLLILQDLQKQLETDVNEIDDLLAKGDLDAAEQARLQGMSIDLQGKIEDQTLAQEKGAIEARHQRSDLGTWEDRVRSLTGQRLAIEARSNQLADEQRQLSATASSLLVQAVAASTGVPPAVATAVVSKDVKAALLQEASAQLGDPNSDISKAVAHVSASAQELQDFYVTASKNYQALRATGNSLKQAADVIQRPTFDSLVGAGTSLWGKLPEAQRKQLTSWVIQSVPTAGLMESYQHLELSAQDATALRNKIETLALERIPLSDIRADLDTVAKQIVKNQDIATLRGNLATVYKGIANVELTEADYRIFVEQFVRIGASDLFAMIPEPQRIVVARAMGEPTVEGAITMLAEEGISALPRGKVQGRFVTFTVRGKPNTIAIKTLFTTAAFENATTGLENLPALYEALVKVPQLRRLALEQFPSDMLGTSVENALRKITDPQEQEQTWAGLTAGMSREATQKAHEMLVHQTLGGLVVEDVLQRKEAVPRLAVPAISPETGGNSTGLSPEANAAAMAALNYAVPGAGVAVNLAQAFAKMDANAAEMNRLADQSLRVMAEQEQLYDLATEAYFQYALADVEQQRAKILRDSAERQLGVYRSEMDRRSNDGARTHLALGVRRGLTYYLSERLREEFDLFDRSFAMWNTGLSSRGAIASEIRADPQNVRYALDSDIHLFDWLNRERESTRGDPDTLRIHWRQMLTLAKEVCLQQGCKPGDGTLGQIAATGKISLKDTLVRAEEWHRFKDWQRNPNGRFVMRFAILPSDRIVPLPYENVRIVDLRLAGRTGTNSQVLNQIALRHSGMSQIPRADKDSDGGIIFQREALLPRQSARFNLPEDFDVNALRTRFDGPFIDGNYPSLRDFEGYGLYALYELTLENIPQNTSLDDIEMNVAYFYHDASNIVSEEKYLSSIRATDPSLPFEIFDYRLVSKVSPSCAGQAGVDQEASSVTIPPGMRTAFSTAFGRLQNPPEHDTLGLLPEARKKSLERIQTCLETRVVKVCKPMKDIRTIAGSWYAAYHAPPTGRLKSSFDPLSPTNDSLVPKDIREKYQSLCQGGRS